MAGPVSRRDLIAKLRALGFSGPFAGHRHEFMLRSRYRLPIPNPHESAISGPLLTRLLSQAGITEQEWDNA